MTQAMRRARLSGALIFGVAIAFEQPLLFAGQGHHQGVIRRALLGRRSSGHVLCGGAAGSATSIPSKPLQLRDQLVRKMVLFHVFVGPVQARRASFVGSAPEHTGHQHHRHPLQPVMVVSADRKPVAELEPGDLRQGDVHHQGVHADRVPMISQGADARRATSRTWKPASLQDAAPDLADLCASRGRTSPGGPPAGSIPAAAGII